MPAVFTSPDELDAHLAGGDKHDVFVYDGPDREVVLENDCRRYPLRLRATFARDASRDALDTFARRCRDAFGVEFASSLPGAQKARIPGVAVKIGVYTPLDTLEVHFYKSSSHRDRRTIIAWVMGDQ